MKEFEARRSIACVYAKTYHDDLGYTQFQINLLYWCIDKQKIHFITDTLDIN